MATRDDGSRLDRDMVRHATTRITDDIYTSVFEDLDREAAEATVAVVPTPWIGRLAAS